MSMQLQCTYVNAQTLLEHILLHKYKYTGIAALQDDLQYHMVAIELMRMSLEFLCSMYIFNLPCLTINCIILLKYTNFLCDLIFELLLHAFSAVLCVF